MLKIKIIKMKFFNYIVITPEEDFEVTSRDRLFVISPEYPDIDNLMENKIIIKMKIYFLLMSLLVILKYIIKQLKKKKEIRRQIQK